MITPQNTITNVHYEQNIDHKERSKIQETNAIQGVEIKGKAQSATKLI